MGIGDARACLFHCVMPVFELRAVQVEKSTLDKGYGRMAR